MLSRIVNLSKKSSKIAYAAGLNFVMRVFI